MIDPSSTLDTDSTAQDAGQQPEATVLALMIAWSAIEPHRAGEVALFEEEGGARILGRGARDSGGRVIFWRQRPGVLDAMPPLAGHGISREQLRIEVRDRALHVERIGRCALFHAGQRVDACTLAPGDSVLLKGQLLLHCTRRPRRLPGLRDYPASEGFAFGDPDPHGMVGESPAVWQLRDRLAWLAQTGAHVLVLGPSGTGKELAARALHSLSSRAARAFVARSAATIPATLIEAEMFGNSKGYPNPGMPERPGLVGAAHGGTLFLDEIGELPIPMQASLLRVLDSGGEYHRLGAASAQRADIRFIGATNRDPGELKHDLAARLSLRLVLPSLDERRDDIPLLVRHLVRRAAATSPASVARFLAPAGSGPGEPRLRPELIEALLARRYTTHLRELEALLWQCMAESRDDIIAWAGDGAQTTGRASTPGEASQESAPATTPAAAPDSGATSDPRELSADRIRASIQASGGNVSRAARALGLSSRFALYRLMTKHGIDAGDERDPPPDDPAGAKR